MPPLTFCWFVVAPCPAPVSVEPLAVLRPVSRPFEPTVQKKPTRSTPFVDGTVRLTVNVLLDGIDGAFV